MMNRKRVRKKEDKLKTSSKFKEKKWKGKKLSEKISTCYQSQVLNRQQTATMGRSTSYSITRMCGQICKIQTLARSSTTFMTILNGYRMCVIVFTRCNGTK